MRSIPLFKVYMPSTVIVSLEKTLMSGFIGQGPRVEDFEKELKQWLGYKYLATVNTGTSALHLALRLLKIGVGDEVISTPLTCTATNWPVLLSGADLVWADVNRSDCNISVSDIKAKVTSRTKAILVVHWGGYACDLDELAELGIPIIEDCAHSFGAEYSGKKIGTSGNLCAFSFQAIKTFTTIDGGMLTMAKQHLKRAKLLRWYGIDREDNRKDFRCENDIAEYGDKLHMNDIAAVIGSHQLLHVDRLLRTQRENAHFYNQHLKDLSGVTLLQQESNRNSSYWLYTILVDNQKDFIRYMSEQGVSCSRVHERNDIHSCVKQYKVDLPNVDYLTKSMVCIPVGWWVTTEDREYILECMRRGW